MAGRSPSGWAASVPTRLTDRTRRIVDVVLDEESVARRSPEVEHERAVALFEEAGKVKPEEIQDLLFTSFFTQR